MPNGFQDDTELIQSQLMEFNFHVLTLQEETEINKIRRRLCRGCPAELSSTLDAYYGRDPDGKFFCGPCRKKSGI